MQQTEHRTVFLISRNSTEVDLEYLKWCLFDRFNIVPKLPLREDRECKFERERDGQRQLDRENETLTRERERERERQRERDEEEGLS